MHTATPAALHVFYYCSLNGLRPSLTAAILAHSLLSPPLLLHLSLSFNPSPTQTCLVSSGPLCPPHCPPSTSQPPSHWEPDALEIRNIDFLKWSSLCFLWCCCFPVRHPAFICSLLSVLCAIFSSDLRSYNSINCSHYSSLIQLTAIIILHSLQWSFIYLQTSSFSFKVTMKRIINKFKNG